MKEYSEKVIKMSRYSLNEYKYLIEDEEGNAYFIANYRDGDYVVKLKEDGNIIWMRKIVEWNSK